MSRFIRDNGIHIISQDEFERNDTVTNLDRNEYVALSDGVYMQIVDRGSEENKTDTFATNDEICVRYIERSIMGDSIQSLNVFIQDMRILLFIHLLWCFVIMFKVLMPMVQL